MGNLRKGYLYAMMSAVIYGCMPLMAKYIYAEGVTPITLVFLRNAFSLIPLALLAYAENKTLRVNVKKIPYIILLSALGCCITPILLFSSYSFMDSGTATVFHFVYPALVAVFEIVFMRKGIRFGNLICVALCVLGIGLFYSPQYTPSTVGSILALSSGVTFAAYVVLLSAFDKSSVSGFLFTFYITVASSVLSLTVGLVSNTLVFPSTLGGWGLCVLFSLLVTTGAVVLFQKSAFLIGSERTSILSTLEPITSVVVGIVVFNEPLRFRTMLGSVFVVFASLLIVLLDYKEIRKKKA